MNAIEFSNSSIASTVCEKLLENNIFSKVTRDTVIRFTPPLTISKYQMESAIDKIYTSINAI